MSLSPVDRLRQMIGASSSEYTIGTSAYWSDDQLQDALDNNVSQRLVQAPVQTYPTVAAGTGGIVHLQGHIPVRGLLDLETLQVISFTGRVYDPGEYAAQNDGRVAFDADQLGAGPLASGICYDINAAAAEILQAWASAVKLGYDISTDHDGLSRSQRHRQLLAQADVYAAKALPGTVDMVAGQDRSRSTREMVSQSFERLGRWV